MTTDTPSPKFQLFEHFAEIAKALAHPVRWDILEVLSQGERSVDSLARAVNLPMANVSHHLQLLRGSGVLTSRREAQQIIYSLADTAVLHILIAIRDLAGHRNAEVARIVREAFESRDKLEPVSRERLLDMAQRGEVMVLDVRPAGEFEAGHIPGAVNISLKDLPARLAELPRNLEIIAYCRGPYCLLSFDAVERLRAAGYQARRLVDGFPEWVAESRPVETGGSIY